MMSRFFILMVFGICTIGCDDDIAPSQIPSVVENTFKSNFPYATDVEWESYKNDFEVDFELKRIDHSARIDRTGGLLEYKYEIPHNAVPPAIIIGMKTEYPKRNWDDPEILVRGNTIYYQLEIDAFFDDEKILLDSTGIIIKNIKPWK